MVATKQSRFCFFQIPVENVSVPTVKVLALAEGRDPEVVLQWSGLDVLEPRYLDGEQFFFPIPMAPDDVHWMGHPEKFQVIYVGLVRRWPGPAGAGLSQLGRPDEHVLWVASSYHGMLYKDGAGPASFATPLAPTLADQEYGVIIEPVTYCNLNVLEQIKREFAVQAQ